MLIREHAETARCFLSAADSELASGDMLQGCEKLWGAASHALIALAQTREWRHGSHGAMRAVVLALADETGDDSLLIGFKTWGLYPKLPSPPKPLKQVGIPTNRP